MLSTTNIVRAICIALHLDPVSSCLFLAMSLSAFIGVHRRPIEVQRFLPRAFITSSTASTIAW